MADKFMDTLGSTARDAQAAADERERAERIAATYGNAIASGYRRRWPVRYKVDDAPGGAEELETLLNTRADEGWLRHLPGRRLKRADRLRA